MQRVWVSLLTGKYFLNLVLGFELDKFQFRYWMSYWYDFLFLFPLEKVNEGRVSA